MSLFRIRGQVVPFIQGQWNIRVQNVEDLRDFWRDEGIATHIDWAGETPPLVTVSAQHSVNLCQPGDEVVYTIEAWDRADGRRIKGIDLEVISRSESL